MYNPQSVHECDKERTKRTRRGTRRLIDTAMTGVGLIASVSSVPQVVHIFQTKTVAGLSLATQLIALGAVAAWFFYGLYIRNRPLAITSGVTIAVLGTVVIQILLYR